LGGFWGFLTLKSGWIRPGPNVRVGNQILARKRLGWAGPLKKRPEKMT